MATIRVVATARGFDGTVVREPGEEFDMPADTFDGVLVPQFDKDGAPVLDAKGNQVSRLVKPSSKWLKLKEAPAKGASKAAADLV